MFTPEATCDNVHSQQKRMIMLTPEPNFWIHAVSINPCLNRRVSSNAGGSMNSVLIWDACREYNQLWSQRGKRRQTKSQSLRRTTTLITQHWMLCSKCSSCEHMTSSRYPSYLRRSCALPDTDLSMSFYMVPSRRIFVKAIRPWSTSSSNFSRSGPGNGMLVMTLTL